MKQAIIKLIEEKLGKIHIAWEVRDWKYYSNWVATQWINSVKDLLAKHGKSGYLKDISLIS